MFRCMERELCINLHSEEILHSFSQNICPLFILSSCPDYPVLLVLKSIKAFATRTWRRRSKSTTVASGLQQLRWWTCSAAGLAEANAALAAAATQRIVGRMRKMAACSNNIPRQVFWLNQVRKRQFIRLFTRYDSFRLIHMTVGCSFIHAVALIKMEQKSGAWCHAGKCCC